MVGVGLYQGMEFVLQRGMRTSPARPARGDARALLQRPACARSLVWRLTLGRDHERNWDAAAACVTDASLPSVSVVVPVRDGERTIAACLDALLAQEYPGRVEVIVVDNGSTDGTSDLARSRPVVLVHEPRQGRAIARNAGIARSTGEIVAFVDADCVAEPGWLTMLVEPFADAGVGGVGGEIHSVPPVTAVQVYLDRKEAGRQQYCVQGGRRKRHGFLITANAAYRRSVLSEVGGFDPSFITAEDVDLGWRVRHAGHTLAYAPDAIVRHWLRETIRDLFRQRYGYGYGRVLFRRRHGLERGYSLGTYRELGDAALRAARLTVASARRPELADDASFARCETVERLAARSAHCDRHGRPPGPPCRLTLSPPDGSSSSRPRRRRSAGSGVPGIAPSAASPRQASHGGTTQPSTCGVPAPAAASCPGSPTST